MIYNIKRDDIDLDNLVLSKINDRLFFPSYNDKVLGKDNVPIYLETPFITLSKNGAKDNNIFTHRKELPYFELRCHSDTKNENMKTIFSFLENIDGHFMNKSEFSKEIIKDKHATNHKYFKLANERTIKDKDYKIAKFKFNYVQSKGMINNVESDVPTVKVYYKSKSKNSYYKFHNVDELYNIFKSGTRIRFILYLNKMWTNHVMFGFNLKIMQIEIDENQFFKNDPKKLISAMERHDNFVEEERIFGPSRKQKRMKNDRIMKILNESDFSANYHFDDDDFVQVEPLHINI